MNVYLDFRTLFYLFCIGQGITTVLVLFWRSDQPANRWLAWLISGLTLQVLDYFLSFSGIYAANNRLYFMPLFFSWSFGPLLYEFVRARDGQTRGSAPTPQRIFVPVVVQTLFYLVLVFQSLKVKTWFWIEVHKPFTRYLEYYVACGFILYAIYRSRSFATDRPLRWLLNGLAVFYVIAVIDPLLNHLYTPPYWPKFYLTTQILPLFVYALALIGLLVDRLQKIERERTSQPVNVTTDQRQRLLDAIRDGELYKDPDLSLTSLAQRLGESPNAVSRIINTGFNQSFNEFINTYRIEEVKRRMTAGDADRLTILALAFEAGFASKTTFNRVFKEQTGQTPKEFLGQKEEK